MASEYQRSYEVALRHIHAQTAYPGPWHILVHIDGQDPQILETVPTTDTAITHAYSLSSQSQANVCYLIAQPDKTAAVAIFRRAWLQSQHRTV
jgi:hypothetical protein